MPEASDTTFDALVIGAGAGGMAAAARLNWHGYRTVLVEARDRVGGRASTVEIDGFRVNTGALIIETGGENGKLFDDIGVPMGTRLPVQPLVLRLGKHDIPMMNGTTGVAFRCLVGLVGILGRRFPRLRPSTGALFAAEPADVEVRCDATNLDRTQGQAQ
jgi:phytoene desaturase